ncbi:ATP-binding protein [Streptomyces minutiscleroticus]
MEHGVRADPRQRVSVEIFADEDTISATVTDPGRWDTDTAASRRAARGTGLTVIHGLSERVEIARSIRGTRVTMHHRRRPVPTAHDPS